MEEEEKVEFPAAEPAGPKSRSRRAVPPLGKRVRGNAREITRRAAADADPGGGREEANRSVGE